jgi:phage shock protein C
MAKKTARANKRTHPGEKAVKPPSVHYQEARAKRHIEHHKHHDIHPAKTQLEQNMEHFGKEVEALGDRVQKHVEERRKIREGWYHRTFGFVGPFISAVFGMIVFFIAIWLIGVINMPIGNVFMSDLSDFLLNSTGLFFLAFLLFSYSSYFSRYYPRIYMPFSPVVIAAAITFALWLVAGSLNIANFFLVNPVIFDTVFWIGRLLPAIFGTAVLLGYIVVIAKISVESTEEGKALLQKRNADGRRQESPSGHKFHERYHHLNYQKDGEIRRLYRSGKDKILGGVCGGLGEYFHVDPVIIRLLFVILIFAWGLGILFYILAWIVIPRNPEHKWDK